MCLTLRHTLPSYYRDEQPHVDCKTMRIHLAPQGSRAQAPAHSCHCSRSANRRRAIAAFFTSVGVCGITCWVVVWVGLLILTTPSRESPHGGLIASARSRGGPLAAVAQPSASGSPVAGDSRQHTQTALCKSNLSEWVAGHRPAKCWQRFEARGAQIPRETTSWNTSSGEGQIARRECVQRHLFAAHGLDTLREYFMQGCNVPPMLDFESWAQGTGCGSEPLSGPLLIHTAWSGPYDHVREDMDALIDSFLATQVTMP